jgi:hypothetical protein
MINKTRVTVATLAIAGALGVTGLASATPTATPEVTSVKCPSICPQIVFPVTCTMSDGSTLTFINRCYADVYACKHRLTIISCRPAGD